MSYPPPPRGYLNSAPVQQSTFPAPGQFVNMYGPPPGANGSNPPTGYPGPPTTMQPPPPGSRPGTTMMPPNQPPPAFPGPPQYTGGSMAPPLSTSNQASTAPPSAKPNVMFFSTAGGVPVPNANLNLPPSGAPTPIGGLSMPPPPISSPPTGGPPGMFAPPPTGTMGPPSGGPQGVAMYGVGAPSNYPGMPNAVLRDNSMVGMPSAFDSSPNLVNMSPNSMPGQGVQGPGGANMNNPQQAGDQYNANTGGAPLPLLTEMDLSIQCNPCFMRTTIGKIVNNQASANATRIPLGIVCKPMFGDRGTTNDEIEVVDFGSTGIVRCKRCRTYINPFVTWADNGRRWRCNICGMLNDVPTNYFSHLDSNGQRRDKDQRPELSRCSVEFVAPGDYMVRPPQPPVYFFVIDVSEPSLSSGMIQCCVNAIKASLDDLPGTSRTQIGFITFDSTIHFYNLKSSLTSPQMLVVSDIADIIMPSPEDLLVNLQDSRAVIESLLDSLPTMFIKSIQNGNPAVASNSCLGPALDAAKRVIQHLGGKLLLFQSSLPNVGEGSLKMRENPRLIGTDKEHTLLNPEDPWYKTNGIDFSRLQVSVDVFLFSSQYTDLATISVLAKYSSGCTYYYPAFHAPRDGAKFEKELTHDLTRSTAFEAVMRVRATRGLRFSNFYGNYFIRGTDLLALPNCTSDSTFSLDMSYEENQLSAQVITIQSALLYTSSAGERRIRVHTMVLPVTNSATEMVESLDIDCAMNLLSKQAVDIAQKTGMENARSRVHQITVEMMRAAKSASGVGVGMSQYGPGQAPASAPIPNSLLLLPLYSMSLQKSLVIRGGTDVRIDERAYFQHLLFNMDIEESKVFIYPRMFSIHDMSTDIGLPSDNADDEYPTAGNLLVRLPNILNLSYERLTSDGIFLMENGYDMFMWIGRSVNPSILNTLFGSPSVETMDMSTAAIRSEDSDFSSRVNAVVTALREDRARYMQLHFIKEGDGYAEAYFARYLIEDRANFQGMNLSYSEYHALVTRAVSGHPG